MPVLVGGPHDDVIDGDETGPAPRPVLAALPAAAAAVGGHGRAREPVRTHLHHRVAEPRHAEHC